MGINKVNYGNTTLIDTSNVTVTADKLASGYTALDNTGTLITGTVTAPNYRELTVTPTDSVQKFTPNYTPEHTKIATITQIGTFSNNSGAGTSVSISASALTLGQRYIIEGEISKLSNGNPTTHNTIYGEWVCGTSMMSCITMYGNYPADFTNTYITPDTWHVDTANSSIQLYINMDVYEASSTHYDGFSLVTVNAASGINIGTKTYDVSANFASGLSFTDLSGEPKAFFVRCTTQSSSVSSSYYYIVAVVYDGTSTSSSYMYNSRCRNYSSKVSFSYAANSHTLSVSSSAQQTSSPGLFVKGTYELTYIY